MFDNFWYKELELTKSFIESVVSIPSRFVIEFISDEIETNWFWNVFVFNCFIVTKIEIQQPGKSILLNKGTISYIETNQIKGVTGLIALSGSG